MTRMFCPLCKSEFRDGFARCSDCRIALVPGKDEASSIATEVIWEGDQRDKCNRILDALMDAGVPVHSKELLTRKPWPWLSIAFWRFTRPRPTCEFKVWVLHRNVSEAKAALAQMEELEQRYNAEED